MKKIQAVRGMNDLLPDQSPYWQYLESVVSQLLLSFGYREIRMPILESTELFKRTIGEVTDIVEKEMYTFEDRNGDSLSLRPEGTAGCVRACEQNGLLFNQEQRLWYTGPMFRHERPQKGRLRQFHQIGVEAFGMTGPDIDAEMILLTARLWKKLGIENAVQLQINSLGSAADRAEYRRVLVEFLAARKDQLDEDSQNRLVSNPMRILDSKDANTQALLHDAPKLSDYLSEDSKTHFAQLLELLDTAGISYQVNQRLVRGLDYYCKTVFEWVTDHLGSQGTVCAGGRYDGLVEQLGGKSTPAVGFAMGVERLTLLLEELNLYPAELTRTIDVYFAAVGDVQKQAITVVEGLRDALPQLRLQVHCGGGNFKNQLKRADKSGALIALILGEDEAAKNQLTVKYLRDARQQKLVQLDDLSSLLKNELNIT